MRGFFFEIYSKMTKLYPIIFLLLLGTGAIAQRINPGCATPSYLDEVNARTDLSREQKDVLIEAFAISQEAFNRQIAEQDHKDDQTLVIPVVFHVIHTYGAENIPNNTIYATINLLNREYNKKNAPHENVVSPFNQWIGNANIEFRLATIDPDGKCTNGIIRHYDPMSYCNTLECNKAVKVKYRWPREQYMNCHIVGNIQTEGGGIVQGFSHFPFPPYSLADSIDANAMIYTILPTNLNDQGGVNTSVTTHEIGHWLGLYHTWGKTDFVADPVNCQDDDDVFDTPNCIGLRSVCQLGANTCNEDLPGDTIDNTQNFMDYSHCYAMFTQGQTDRVRGVLKNVPHRKPLITQENLIATGTNYTSMPTNLCAADFTANINYEELELCPGQKIKFSDLSWHSVSSRKWTFTGGSPETSTDSVATVSFNQPGVYSITLEVKNGTDTETITKNQIIRVAATNALGGAYSQDFENIDLNTSTDFEINDIRNVDSFVPDNSKFELSNTVGYSSTKSVVIHNFRTSSTRNIDELITNTMNITGTTNNALAFKYSCAQRPDSANNDELNIFISTDCGLSWTKRKSIKGVALYSAAPSATEFAPTSPTEWKNASISLSSVTETSLRIKFEFVSGGGNNLYIDNINIHSPDGIEETIVESSINLYPNPSKYSTELSFNLVKTDVVRISLADMTGRQVQRIENRNMNAGEQSVLIPTADLSSGIYLVNLSTSAGNIVRKLIVN